MIERSWGREVGGHFRHRFGDTTLEIRGEDDKVDLDGPVKASHRYAVVQRESKGAN